jgi:hypothetical protein
MSWVITGAQPFPAVIGEAFGGGYFAGYISHTADGNPTHALIVAPRATGATGTGYTLTTTLKLKNTQTSTPGADSFFDGVANTAAMVTEGIANFPAAQFCTELSIEGFTDWYLPSRFELTIAYFNLKPTSTLNVILASTGPNIYAVPPRSGSYTTDYPAQTPISAFNTSAEAFSTARYWSSTETAASAAWDINFGTGSEQVPPIELTRNVRAFRRIAL